MEASQAKELIGIMKQIEQKLDDIAQAVINTNSMIPPISIALQNIPGALEAIQKKIK